MKTIEGYRFINTQSFETLGTYINDQIKLDPSIKEIKYAKEDNQAVYRSYALLEDRIPTVNGFDFMDSGGSRELAYMLSTNVREESLPLEIRVICPNQVRDNWGVFFRKK